MLLLAAVALGGCSGGGGAGGTSGGGNDGSGTGGAPACEASLFAATPVSWALPAGTGFSFTSGIAAASNCPSYATSDMNGDGKPDLVLTSDCDTTSGVGTDHWLVYANTGSGFAATAGSWSLPAKAGFSFTGGLETTYNCPVYATTDLNGDGKPELVIMSDCDSTSGVGTDHWLVYANTGSGFAATAQSWPLPAGAGFKFTVGLAAVYNCPEYATSDLTGDGKPDLVVTADCGNTTGVGTDHWLVYANSGSGFASTGASWALPAGAGFSFTDGLAAVYSCPEYGTSDFDGDGKPDLVITYDCGNALNVGTDHWLVYANTGAGFAGTALSWALPTGMGFTFKNGLGALYSCPVYGTDDFDGDGKPELVITSDCGNTTGVGTDHWLVSRNMGAGFNGGTVSWTLPPGSGYSFTGGLESSTSCPGYATRDLDGDGRPDLVITSDCGNSVGVGTDHWLVYPASCH
jgi:hypothetical protein